MPDYDMAIKRLVVTSDLGDWGDVPNLQYALWLIEDTRSTNIYAVPLPPNALLHYNPYASVNIWTVVPPTYTEYCTVEDLAIAQWPLTQTPGRLHALPPYSGFTDAAAVVLDHTLYAAGTSLWLYLNAFSVNLNTSPLGSIYWEMPIKPLASRIALTPHINSTVVAMAHAFAFPGRNTDRIANAEASSVQSSSTFYVVYNVPILTAVVGRQFTSSEIVAVPVRVGGGGASPLLLRTARIPSLYAQTHQAVTAMALLPSPDGNGVYLYLSISTARHIQLVKWVTQAPLPSSEGGGGEMLPPLGTDEVFFSTDLAGGPLVRSLFILWPSTSLSPIFFALVVDPARDAASAQSILHARNGPPRRIYMADFVQRSFVPIQDMPLSTSPMTLAATGTDVGKATLIASDLSGSVYGLPVLRCSDSSTVVDDASSSAVDSPRYWDGAQCLNHACVRARACAIEQGQVWNARALRCACAPGYFMAMASTDTNLICQACAPVNGVGYYCGGGNGTRSACPATMTSPVGARAVTDCFCLVGQYYSYSAALGGGDRCAACPAGSWCPNRWDAKRCPGDADSMRSSSGSVYPTACVCSQGAVGASCAPCPPGFYCPATAVAMVSNNAVRLTLVPIIITTTNTKEEGVPDERTVCASLTALLSVYFKEGSLWYLKDPQALARRLYCTLALAPAGRTSPLSASNSHTVMLMVQTETADSSNSIITNLPAVLRLQMNAINISTTTTTTTDALFFRISEVLPAQQPLSQMVRNNTALACPPGKTPTSDSISCICAPGYQLLVLTCSACPSGQYKAASGPGTCAVCPLGTVSATTTAASSCTIPGGGGNTNNNNNNATNNNNNNNNGDSSNNNANLNIPLIAGGVAAGVLVTCCLVYAIVSFAS
jgi:hypothetical protein